MKAALQNSLEKQGSEIRQARKKLSQSERRIADLNRLFTRLYEDNVPGKLTDERFKTMSEQYETEKNQLKELVSELTAFITAQEHKTADTEQFIATVKKYTEITELSQEILHKFIEKTTILMIFLDFVVYSVHKYERINLVQRAVLPCGNFRCYFFNNLAY